MKTIDVCLTPELLSQHELANQTVVVVDILRATSSMVTAFAHGAKQIVPVAHPEECRAWRTRGYLIAGERDGRKINNFDLGNSPLEYAPERVRGQLLAMTTTNGTRTIEEAKGARQLIIGAFLNLNAVTDFLRAQASAVVIACAGWKGHVNLEDTLFAGAVVSALSSDFGVGSDAALVASTIYRSAQSDLAGFLAQSSHVRRLQQLGCQDDIAYCLRTDLCPVVPMLQGHCLVANDLSTTR
ncbi:MAG: 2-phosphosulfolactate phosphatase [Tunicatimonas sp.]